MINQKPKIQIIGGPCSAESKAQILELAAWASDNEWSRFRAGLWKPRTRPGSFEGVGQKGLSWLKEAEMKSGVLTMTEVATPKQAEQVLKSEISGFWIGARTSLNPFYVQEIAEVVRGADIEVWIKNPMHPDLNAWAGAIERLQLASVKKVGAIHRGFFLFRSSDLRNSPIWSIPLGLKREFPDLDIFCDVSHIAGHRDRVADLIRQALYLRFSGIMVEVHENPVAARTDAQQQIDPATLVSIIHDFEKENNVHSNARSTQILDAESERWKSVIREEINRLEKLNVDIPSQMGELISNFGIDMK